MSHGSFAAPAAGAAGGVDVFPAQIGDGEHVSAPESADSLDMTVQLHEPAPTIATSEICFQKHPFLIQKSLRARNGQSDCPEHGALVTAIAYGRRIGSSLGGVSVKRLIVCFVYCAVAAGCGSGAGKKTTGTGGAGGIGGVGGVGGSTGSAGTSGTCTFTACGGDLVGTWNVESLCSPNVSGTCPPYVGVTVDRSQSAATYTFAANGSFTYAAAGTLTETIRYMKDCLKIGADAGVSEL